jgi:hydroxyacylglutathione hydrolase
MVALLAAGAQLLDVRGAGEFAQGHVRGALNVGLDGKFATWQAPFSRLNDRS